MGREVANIAPVCESLFKLKHSKICELTDFLYAKTDYKTDNNLPALNTLKPFDNALVIKGCDDHYWFYTKIKPQKKQEGKKLFFELKTGHEGERDSLNPQSIVYLDGKMLQGMDVNHTEVRLEFDREYEMYIYLYTGTVEATMTFNASLAVVDERIEKLYYDIHVPFEAAMCFEENNDSRIAILKELAAALHFLDLRRPMSDEFYKSIEETEKYLFDNLYNSDKYAKSGAVVNCIGHTHIDVAWLWTLRQTEEKVQRSFSTVLNLMKQYPEYKFMSSQPQLYEYAKKNAPEMYAEIKERIKEGRWEAEGAMWLEADCNLTSGESLVRQIMFGKRFMKEEFGVDNKIVWLPDVFGYSAALPQIMKKCGIERFVTSKISWNETDLMPYDSFMWEGIDGSEIFTYFITAQDLPASGKPERFTTYVGYIRPKQVLGTWERYQQKELNNETIITFGFGDGGGGPTADMLEQQRRLSYGLPGFPRTKMEFAGEFLNKVKENFDKNTELLRYAPRWVGELYLERHRGTYTSIAKNKRNNRKSELALQSGEQLSVADNILLGGEYDGERLTNDWKTVLLNQFHDIVPGSSIFEVYEQSDKDYKRVLESAGGIINSKIDSISSNVKTSGGIFVYNPNGYECSGVVKVDDMAVFAENIPSCGYRVVTPAERKNNIEVSKTQMENKFYKIVFDEKMNITSLYDKENNREVVLPNGRLNELQVFEDIPKDHDAWEISEYYKEKMWTVDNIVSVDTIDEGARKGLKITRKYLESEIEQTIYVYEDMRRIDFDTVIDWKEEHQLLKASFPMDINASEATYDIQFGNIKRPTHQNTSWDKAKFEVCAHKWADISEDGYGVAIMNDCKYGYSAEGSVMKLTLLKCATHPNPYADKEVHRFRYSLLPHRGDFKEGEVVREAQLFNRPFITKKLGKQDGILPEEYSMISSDCKNIVIDTIKRAEDNDDIIVRMYDSFNRRTAAKIRLGFDFREAKICDLLENPTAKAEKNGRVLKVPVGNYEAVTLRISL